ncbi:MAG: hypothetical protein ABI618_16820 [Nitrospirota bacterium]
MSSLQAMMEIHPWEYVMNGHEEGNSRQWLMDGGWQDNIAAQKHEE